MKKILLCVVMLLAGCGNRVTAPEISRAQSLCANFGGVNYIVGGFPHSWTEAACKDGSRVSSKTVPQVTP